MKRKTVDKKGFPLARILLLSTLLVVLFTLPAAAATIEMQVGQIQMWVDGSSVRLDAPPYITDGRTMVPLRAIAEAFGAEVSAYNVESGLQARIEYKNEILFLTVGDQGAHFYNEDGNDTPVYMDVAPEIRSGRMFVPLRFIAEGFGAIVNWNQFTKTITISDDTQSYTDSSFDLTVPATYLPFSDMQLHYYRNYADGTYGYETVYTQEPPTGSSYFLDTAVLSDEYGETPEYNYHYMILNDGIYEYYATSTYNESLMPWLKNNLHVGQTWEYAGDYGSIFWEVEALDQTIEVGSITFENCLVVEVDNQAVGLEFRRYYAPHLGLVLEESPPGGYVTARLESWQTVK